MSFASVQKKEQKFLRPLLRCKPFQNSSDLVSGGFISYNTHLRLPIQTRSIAAMTI